jgi:diadenosine tetraphosphatase ApaH/serine/threonine PP2A family protein phosphatase
LRVLIVSDIHSNLAAFEAVLRRAESAHGIDRLWCPGDIVGYGPDPVACVDLMRRYSHLAVCGNHDLAAIDRISTSDFNMAGARAAEWTGTRLRDDEKQLLAGLPQVIQEGEFTLVHGSLRAPVWEYLLSPHAAEEQFRRMETAYSLIGHSHIPFVAHETADGLPTGQAGLLRMAALRDGDRIELGEQRLIINPGSVGQPRDGDPRASCAVLDLDERTLTLHRMEYDIAATQEKIRAEGLPLWLAERLSFGQ